METKTDDYCSQCPQKNGCRDAYETLGRSDAPSVVGKVIIAFLLPIGVFAGLLVGFDKLLPASIPPKIRTLAIFALSAGLTFAAVYLINCRGLRKHPKNLKTRSILIFRKNLKYFCVPLLYTVTFRSLSAYI